jgi:hypothetical protein
MNFDSAENTSLLKCGRAKRKDCAGKSGFPNLESYLPSGLIPAKEGQVKRQRRSKALPSFESSVDKENFHRSRPLAPRSRSARILQDLVIDLPTDCSDYEILESDDEKDGLLGSLFVKRELRINDRKNEFYNFAVHED